MRVKFADGVVLDDWEVKEFRKPGGTSDAPGGSEDDVDEILFQGWLQKKSGATSGGKMSGKKALKNAT